jgi:hypothetical protein
MVDRIKSVRMKAMDAWVFNADLVLEFVYLSLFSEDFLRLVACGYVGP